MSELITSVPNVSKSEKELSLESCFLTVAQMATALGLKCCDYWATHPHDCDVCSNAKEEELIWVMMSYGDGRQEAEYYACSACVPAIYATAFVQRTKKVSDSRP